MVEKELFKSNINALFWEPTMYTMVDYLYGALIRSIKYWYVK